MLEKLRMPIEYLHLTHQQFATYANGLADLLRDAVDNGASVNFLPPLAPAEAQHYWDRVAARLAHEEIILLVAVDAGRVVGTVQIVLAWQPNAPHRADIQKLLVQSTRRRHRIATQLLQRAEATAQARGRWLLILDTERGSGAEALYTKMGYTPTGMIPHHAINAAGAYADTVLFWKILDH